MHHLLTLSRKNDDSQDALAFKELALAQTGAYKSVASKDLPSGDLFLLTEETLMSPPFMKLLENF